MTSIVNKLIEGEANGDSFGHAVSLSSDGSIVAISAPNNEGTLTSFDIPNYASISEDTELYYQIAGSSTWSIDGIYTSLFPYTESKKYDWKFRDNLSVSPSIPYEENPYINVIEISNLSDGRKNIFGIIFDNVKGTSGETYTTTYLNEEWSYKDDVVYLIEDTNINSSLDKSDLVLAEVNKNNRYTDFGGLSSNGGSYVPKDSLNPTGYASYGNENDLKELSYFHNKKGLNAGSVKIFKTNGLEWIQLGDEILGDSFYDQKGVSISLSGDGTTLAVGNPLSLNSSLTSNDYVSVYKLNDGTWLQIGNDIKSSDNNETISYEVTVAEKTSSHDYYGSGSDYGYKIDDKFTYDLSLVSGNTYKFNQSDSTNANHPLAFYLDRNKATLYTNNISTIGTPGTAGAYTEIKVDENTPTTLYYQCANHNLMGDSIRTNSDIYSDYFGYSTSLSSNGNVLAVSGFYGELSGKSTTGYVKIYENNGQEFKRIGDLLLGDSLNSNEFGFSLDLSSDGSIVAVSSAAGGNIFIYKRSGDNWIKQGNTISFIDYDTNQKLDSLLKEEFVVQVKMTEDGKYIAVGSPNSDDNGLNSGILKVYKESDSSWVQVGEDIKGKNLDHLGTYIDIEEDSNGFLTLAASGTKENGESYVNIYKLFGTDWISFTSFDSTDNQGFPTSSLDISNNGRYLVSGTSHSPVNNTNYDDNFLSAGYIGFNEETGNARVYDLNAGIIGTKNEAYSADSKGFASTVGSAPVTVTSYVTGQETTLDSIKDYDGNLHAGDTLDETPSAYKYQGMLDVNGDGVFETIFTNKSSKRWVTAEVNSSFGHIDFSDHGQGGTTRVVGIYIDPLVTSGDVVQGSDHDSQRRFQNDLLIDNLTVKTSGDYDNDGFQEVYWKTNDGTAYLRALMHADGNIQYANYQSEAQMSDYLTSNRYESVISEIV